MQQHRSVLFSQGDLQYTVGQRVEFVLVVMDPETGIMRLHPGVGDIIEFHSESVAVSENVTSPFYFDPRSPQYELAKVPPPIVPGQQRAAVGTVGTDHQNGGVQVRIVGFDLRIFSYVPWAPADVPPYYHPKSAVLRANFQRLERVTYLHVPVRHVIRLIQDQRQQALDNLSMVMSRFFRRAPYGWSVLYHEPVATAGNVAETERVLAEFTEGGAHEVAALETRRVVGNVIDFGVDYDGVLKVIIDWQPLHASADAAPAGAESAWRPSLDNYLYHGAFAEVGRINADMPHLFKLPYHWIHDGYDTTTLGEQNYFNVLKHVLCDTLQRFRIKTVKYHEANNTRSFYYGFTEDGYHFAKNGRHDLSTTIPPLSTPSGAEAHSGAFGAERRCTFQSQKWLNLTDDKSTSDAQVRRGFIIYGRLVERPEHGKTTLGKFLPLWGSFLPLQG